jgi:hypothetical protein
MDGSRALEKATQPDSSAADASIRPADLTGVRAVVIDSNIMGKAGDLRLDTLSRISDIAHRDGHLEVWVPEPVLWEWTEHAARTYAETAEHLRASANRLRRAGIQVPELPLAAAELRKTIEDAVARIAHVRVVKLAPQDAVLAIRDQILVMPPGERVAGRDKMIKTGASDSAWMRAVHAEARHASSTYIILSQDNDVHTAYRAWGLDVPLILPSVNALSRLLEGTEFPPMTVQLMQQVVAHIEREEWYAPAFDLVDAGGLSLKALGDDDRYLQVDLTLESVVQSAGLANLDVVDRIGSVQATLFMIGLVEVTGWYHSDATDRLEAASAGVVEALLRTPVLLTPDVDEPEGMLLTFEDTTEARPLSHEWRSADDAFEALLAALRSLPGCEELEWSVHISPGSGRVSGDGSSECPLGLSFESANVHLSWTAGITHSGTTVEVTCGPLDPNRIDEVWTMQGTARAADGSELASVSDPWSCAAVLLRTFGAVVRSDGRHRLDGKGSY